MADMKFSKDHEWIAVDGDVGTVGISEYAQEQLGDVVFVELPETGKTFSRGEEAAVVESVKATSEGFAPVDGEIVETNGSLEDEPGAVNSDAFGGGWFFKIKIADMSQLDDLMDKAAYDAYTAELD